MTPLASARPSATTASPADVRPMCEIGVPTGRTSRVMCGSNASAAPKLPQHPETSVAGTPDRRRPQPF
jgi:hypothetical protein